MSSVRVVIVDDNSSLRNLASRILTDWGYEVAKAGTMPQALDQAHDLRPNAVLADFGLPDGGGFDLTQRLPDLHQPLPIILASSDSGAGISFEPQRLGARGFVPKHALIRNEFRELFARD